MARRRREEDSGPGVPTWILSFSDMITNLLAFFVLLQSFAHVQDSELFFVGQGSYRQAIAGFGVPGFLLGRQDRPRRDFIKVEYPTDEGVDDLPQGRIIDVDNEKIRKVFADLKEQMDTTAIDMPEELVRVESTPIRFAGSEAGLPQEARTYLRQFALELRQTVQAQTLRFYVVGLAADQPDARQQWRVSAARAQAVEKALTELLGDVASGRNWTVYSWGAGAGDDWCRKHGCLPGRTSIVIAIMRGKGENG